MINFSKLWVYRMTHIDNVSHIAMNGLTHVDSENSNPNYIPIGNKEIITVRANRLLNNGRHIGSYLPFYFGFCTPMLYVIQKGYMGVKKVNPIDIVYCVTSIQKILDCQKAFLFTDGQANSALTSYYENDRIGEVNELVDFNAVASKYWFDEEDVDKKRRKEAELLLDGDLTKEFIIGYVCYNEEARTKLINSGVEEIKIVIKRGYYF
ncbi:type II toxin-antitoxin system toxin DNA ADP-ribosyl transferase DarT [Myroides odoratimimus]|uniref:type II toxin-antitoxin system toxin DNA ADP-ribosyl transferase DarT n=1 Tax=Myroides odoratimimus TaxID=76832 RepID=UPI000468C2DE|nr:DUF4433 domain-containing protein [Myroides odoratimimus]